ncbi:hypothetical protein [Streptomyces sp. NBC_00464]|uniref:hypothetical protein n=1 Tax=Streptomyces sp. NBC_00464 TaxID=2975751 RepID=UPI002E18A209
MTSGQARIPPVPGGSSRESPQRAAPPRRHTRLCYDHLAGTVAPAITDAMAGRGLLEWGPSRV